MQCIINGGEDKDLFTIGSNSGLLSFIEKPEFDNPTDKDRDNKYNVIIKGVNEEGSALNQKVNIEILEALEQTYSINFTPNII